MSAPAYHLPAGPRKAPKWVLGDPGEWLADCEERRFRSQLEPVRFEQSVNGDIVEGLAMPYNSWTEIRNSSEGHFLEHFAPNAFSGQVREGLRSSPVQLLFEHGDSRDLGRQVIGKIAQLRDRPDGLFFRASLLRGVPELIVSGLAADVYGTSVRFQPLETARERFPRRSAHNPAALPEHTVLEARVREISVVTFPAYRKTNVQIVTATE